VYGPEELSEILDTAHSDHQKLRMVKSYIAREKAIASEQVEDLLLFERAVDAGMDDAQVAQERAAKAARPYIMN
jgi:hypothetical protein